jgi:hypothetical protein
MIKAALQSTYLKACLNTSRTTPVKKFVMSSRTIVTAVAVPKV